MSVPAMPAVVVEPPETLPRRYGLYSVANMLNLDVHEAFGVEYDPDSCALPESVATGPCGEPVDKALSAEGDRVFGESFLVYSALECRPVGRTLEEIRERARRTLSLGEEAAVERELWAVLADRATDVTPTPGTAVSLREGLRELEHAFAPYGFSGIVYAPRASSIDASYFGRGFWAEREQRVLETPVGNRWAFADHPEPIPGPGTDAGEGQWWIYMTGPIDVRRGDVETPGTLGETLTRTPVAGSDSNNTVSLAERVVVPSVSCPVFAVLVEIGGAA